MSRAESGLILAVAAVGLSLIVAGCALAWGLAAGLIVAGAGCLVLSALLFLEV